MIIFDIHLNTVASLHLELVDRVVDDFLQQHVDTVFWQRAIAQTSDIHTWTCTNMLHIRQMSDVIIIILYLLFDDVVLFVHIVFL